MGELDLDNFIEPLNSERERKSENDSRTGVKACSGFERKLSATEHPLQTTHEVVVREQPERAGFGKAESELVSEHRIRLSQQLPVRSVYLRCFSR